MSGEGIFWVKGEGPRPEGKSGPQERMLPGETRYTEDERYVLQGLVAGACQAEELLGIQELDGG